jgi:hypothetical protein
MRQTASERLCTSEHPKLPVKALNAWFDGHDYFDFFPLQAGNVTWALLLTP